MKKKVLLSAVAALVAVTAVAQNKAIDALVEKYTDAEGFTVVNMQGEAIRGLSSMIAKGNGTINLGDGSPSFNIRELLDEIESVTAIVLDRADETFALEARQIISSDNYSPILSVNEKGQSIKMSSANIRRGAFRGNKELLMTVTGDSNTVVVRIIGKIDTERLARMVKETTE